MKLSIKLFNLLPELLRVWLLEVPLPTRLRETEIIELLKLGVLLFFELGLTEILGRKLIILELLSFIPELELTASEMHGPKLLRLDLLEFSFKLELIELAEIRLGRL